MFSNSWAQVEYPKPSDPPRLVNDFTNTLDANQVKALEDKLVAFADSTSTQIAVVIIATTSDMPISDYTINWVINGK